MKMLQGLDRGTGAVSNLNMASIRFRTGVKTSMTFGI